MISAFKHIRLSGYHLLPQYQNGNTRITLNSSGVAYYSELTGVSGYLQGLINTANADVSSINGLQNAVNITGRDGIQVFIEGQNIVVSGKDAAVQSLITSLSGYSNNTFATINNLALTGSGLAANLASTGAANLARINSLSGYSNSTFATINNLGLTGSNLQRQINSLSGAFTGFTGSLAATFATDAELSAASGILAGLTASTGSTLITQINNLSGTVTGTYATISNLATTGSTLNTRINNLSGTVTGTYATITNLGLTGSTLDSKINSLSGYSNNTFATISNLASTGSNLQNQINSLSGAFTGFTGTLAATFATDAELNSASGFLASSIASTGSNLQSQINSLSGYSNNTFATVTNVNTTGSTLNTRIDSLSGTLTGNYYLRSNPSGFITNQNVVFTTGAQTISGSKTFAASRYVFSGANVIFTDNTGIVSGAWQFANRPTVNGSGVLLSGDIDLTQYATNANLAATGSALNTSINSLSGTLTGNYVLKATQQQFIVTLPINIESTGVTFPAVFASTPNSVQVTFEPSTDVGYMVAIKNRTTAGFTAEFSDVLSEAGNKLNVFASI